MAAEDLDVDLGALLALAGGVDVVESAGQAVVENLISVQCQSLLLSAQGADLKAVGLLVTGLRRSVELELVVGRNVSSATLGVVQGAVAQVKGNGAAASEGLTLFGKDRQYRTLTREAPA